MDVEWQKQLQPLDAFNRLLLEQVHPPNWVNPVPAGPYDLVVIGGGTAGLVTAAGAAGLGAKVALIERNLLGGDCLNHGCVPSKTLIRAARALWEMRKADRLGITTESVSIDFEKVMERVRKVRASLSGNDSASRFKSLGVDVYLGEGSFQGVDTIQAGKCSLRFKKAVIATGTRPRIPAIPGLELANYYTSNTIFTLEKLPARVAVIGAGPIGCELAQALARLGSQVWLLEGGERILARDDAEAAAVVEQELVGDGVTLLKKVAISRIESRAEGKAIHFQGGNATIVADAILVAAGRSPNLDNLNLASVDVDRDTDGRLVTNEYMQTTNRRIYAAGDVCGKMPFTHMADAMARIVIRNALFFGRAKVSSLVVPWCTWTDPELAQVGIQEEEATRLNQPIQTFRLDLSSVDRLVMDDQAAGFVKVHVRKGSDRIVGATIVGAHAGDLITPFVVAISSGIGLGKLSSLVIPYPSQGEVIRKIGDHYNRTRLTPWTRWLLKRILSFPFR